MNEVSKVHTTTLAISAALAVGLTHQVTQLYVHQTTYPVQGRELSAEFWWLNANLSTLPITRTIGFHTPCKSFFHLSLHLLVYTLIYHLSTV